MRSKIVNAAVYLTTGVLTGYQVYYNLVLAIWGVPTSWVEYVSICGSILMLVSAGIGFGAERASHRLAFFAAILEWMFYAPAIVSTPWMLSAEALRATVPVVCLTITTVLSCSSIVIGRRRPMPAG